MIFDYVNCIIGIIQLFIYKLMYPTRIKFSGIIKVNKNFEFAIKRGSELSFGKGVRIRNRVQVRAYDKSLIEIGNNCFFNDDCKINSRKNIRIGNDTIMGQNVLIIDHNHDYKNNINDYICEDIIIGNNVWIGANCVILKGVEIGDNSVIAAGTVVTKNIPTNSIVYNQKNLVIKPIRRVEKTK